MDLFIPKFAILLGTNQSGVRQYSTHVQLVSPTNGGVDDGKR